jgi:1-acyl-sn-glycerol-3-phosphate acyltransferase
MRLPHPRFTRLVRWWHGRLCRLLGLTVHVRGQPGEAVLLVANHVSWLDIPVLGARGPIVFLSKAEVRSWPLVGWMAGIASTLYIERGAHQATHLAADIGMHIRTGCSVAIFPEGTTGDGHDLRRFHPRLFAAAQQPGLRLQPVAIRYGSNTAPDAVAPFIGDDSLVPHLWRVLRQPGIRVEVSFLPTLDSEGIDRRRLAESSRAAIAGALGLDPASAAATARIGAGGARPARATAAR